MVLACIYQKGDSTIEAMNVLASALIEHKMIETCTPDSGVQECSEALCDFEIHIIKKRR